MTHKPHALRADRNRTSATPRQTSASRAPVGADSSGGNVHHVTPPAPGRKAQSNIMFSSGPHTTPANTQAPTLRPEKAPLQAPELEVGSEARSASVPSAALDQAALDRAALGPRTLDQHSLGQPDWHADQNEDQNSAQPLDHGVIDPEGEEGAAEPEDDQALARRTGYHILAMARACTPMCKQVITEREVLRSRRNPEMLMHVARVLAARLRPTKLQGARLTQLREGTLEDAIEAVNDGAMADPVLAWKALCGVAGHAWSRYNMTIESELINQ